VRPGAVQEIDTVICGGIEEEHYHYLRWKRCDVLDAVAGAVEAVLARFLAGGLKSGDMLFGDRGGHV
jgi:predicted Fe-Mo cluster-binding NifX family protein